jgi:outer membrane receptor protein involved in Fe transport
MNRKLQAWLSLFASAAIVAIAPQAARAQSATAAPAQPAQPAQSEPAKKDETEATTDESTAEEVVVTGSRIRRTNFDSAAPVEIITSERAALAGLVSTEEILRGSTAASGEQINDAFQGFLLDGGPGAQQVSLRGLGAQRTLVLVNGRRWSPSGVQGSTNSVDLSAIPSSLIQRAEILKDGASSVYGADAVAGVINVITKEAFDGFQINYSGFTTQHADGTQNVIDATWGRVGERGAFSIGAQYSKREQVVVADRDWSRCPIDPRITDQDNDGVYDNRAPVTGEPLCFGFIYGLASSQLGFLRYEPGAVPGATTNQYYDPRVNGSFGVSGYTRLPVRGLSRVSPVPGPGSATLNALWDNDGAYYTDERNPTVQMMVTPSVLKSVTSFGNYDLDLFGGSSQAYYEAYYNNRDTRSNSGYRQFFPFVNPVTFDGRALHPYNPFAAPFNARGLLSFAGFQPVMPSYNIQNPETRVEVERYNIFAGLKGDLTTAWNYDFTVGYGHSKGTYAAQQWLDDRVEAAVNGIVVNPTTGAVTCAPAVLAQFPTCVPANLTTADAMLRGILPKNVVDFISKDTLGTTVYKGKSASLYLDGPLFTLPAGKVQAVLGAEWREESIDDVPDIEAQNNNFWGFSTAGITRGKDTVTEAFFELETPIVRDLPYAKDITLNVSARWSDYDSYGSDTTYRGSLQYVVNPTLSFRATVGTSFRPPDLYEQFLGDQIGFVSNLGDPCNNFGGGSLRPGDPVYDNCVAQGLPLDYRATTSIPSIVGGASDLAAETSKSKTFGVVFKPGDLGVSMAVDYFDITINDTVASPSVGYILAECYGTRGFTSPFCTRVGPRSNPGSQLAFVDASYVNIGEQNSVGVDTNIVYDMDTESGRFTLDMTATYLIEQNQELFGQVSRLAGRWGFPRWSAEAQARYNWRDYTVAWSVDYIGESKELPVVDPGTTNIDRIFRTPNYLSHAVSLRYAADDWELIGTVRNVFDKDPPFVSGGQGAEGASRVLNTLPGIGYDLLGRSFTVRFAKRFGK